MSNLPNRSWGAAVAGLVLGSFATVMAINIVSVVVPIMMADFKATASETQWVFTIYLLVTGMVMAPSGWLMDRLGYKRCYLGALSLFTAASVACALSPSLPWLIGARVVQGVGSGILAPVSMAIIGRIVPRNRLGTAMGILSSATSATPAIGPVVAGYLMQFGSWPIVFWLMVPFALLGLLLAWRLLPEGGQSGVRGHFDLTGFITVMVGLLALQLALSSSQNAGWTAPVSIGLWVVSAASLAWFVRAELTQAHPMMQLRLLRNPAFVASLLTTLVVMVGIFSGVFYTPIILQTVMGLTPLDMAFVMLPGAITLVLVQTVSGRLFDRFGPTVMVTMGIIIIAGINLAYSQLTPQTSTVTISWLQAIRAVGIGISITPAMAAGLSSVSPAQSGQASVFSNITSRVGSSIGLAAMAALLDSRIRVHAPGGSAGPAVFLRGMNDVFLIVGILTLLALLSARKLVRHPVDRPASLVEAGD